ncbi:MAG: hydroxyneurosporene dehydrogenase [Rhodobacter sp. CACIA14H1]|nr:MAG: hydroxyneurosporene dehydrogenase [Rhodobacter sp. CACIA14H1]
MPTDHLRPPLPHGPAPDPAAAGGAHHARHAGPAVSGLAGGDLRTFARRDDGHLPPPHGKDGPAGALPRGGRRPSGGGGADGSPLREARGRGDHAGPDFRVEVGPDGYAWWYLDGVSDDGQRAVSVIGFIGSVFSPWYAWSGRRNPQNHVCLNVATYGPGGRFTMTDRGTAALRQEKDTLTIGPSRMHWTGRDLVIDIDEISSPPLISRVRGRITLTPSAITGVELALHPRHQWRPFAPTARIDVNLTQGHRWQGHGYFDANFGTTALERDFDFWTWGRFPMKDRALCLYDATWADGTQRDFALEVTPSGEAREVTAPPRTQFARTNWLVRRETRADPGTRPRQIMPMLDAPFYSRSVVETRLMGETTQGVHEALDLTRFRQPLLKPMLAVRVPRRSGWTF